MTCLPSLSCSCTLAMRLLCILCVSPNNRKDTIRAGFVAEQSTDLKGSNVEASAFQVHRSKLPEVIQCAQAY